MAPEMDLAQQLEAFQAVLTRAQAVWALLAEAQSTTQAQLDQAWNAVGHALVPSLDREHLDLVAGALSDATLAWPAWEAAHRAEEARLEALAAELGSHAADLDGQAQLAQEEAARLGEWLESVRTGVARRLADPAFVAALEHQEQARWWSMRWQLANRRGEVLVRRHGAGLGIQTLSQLLEMHRQQCATLETLTQQHSQAARNRALWRSRSTRAADVAAARASLVPRLLEQARMQACGVFHRLTPSQRERCVRVMPAVAGPARRVEGLTARMGYVDALREHLVAPTAEHARHQANRAQMVMDHGMGQVAYTSDDHARLLGARLDEAVALLEGLLAFDRFDAVDLVHHPLWWDWFFDGREPGTFVPEVARFRAEHRDRAFVKPAAAPPTSAAPVVDPFFREGRDALLGAPGSHAPAPDDDKN